MVVYYSRSGHTRAYAQALSKAAGCETFELKTVGKVPGMLGGMFKAIGKKAVPVAMPDLSGADTLYVCTPIWAGGITPQVRYFLQNCGFKGKVRLLATSSAPDGGYADSMAKQARGMGIDVAAALQVSTKAHPVPSEELLKPLLK